MLRCGKERQHCVLRGRRGGSGWEELRTGEVESLGGGFGLYPQEGRGKPVTGFTVEKGSTGRTDWKGQGGQLARKGTSNLSPITGSLRWGGQMGSVRKEASSGGCDARGAVCLSFLCMFAIPTPAGHPPACFRERQSLSWVLWAAVALRLVPRQWLSGDASMAPRMDALEGQPRGQGHSCKRALWPPQRAPWALPVPGGGLPMKVSPPLLALHCPGRAEGHARGPSPSPELSRVPHTESEGKPSFPR